MNVTMKFTKSLTVGLIIALSNTSAFSQINIDPPKEPQFVCPVIEPLESDAIDIYKHYDHYIKQVRGYVKYLGKVTQGQFSPTQVITIFDILKEQYKEFDYISENMADLIDFRNTILALYPNYDGFRGLNTKVATDVANSIRASSLNRLFQNSTLCVAPSQTAKNQFELHFYGVKMQQCERMFRHAGNFAHDILVNGKPHNECLRDHKGQAIRKWALWSNLGKNQVTLVFQR
jgi:hypothetical protein